MQQAICDFEQDEFDDWVAILACGHRQHVRHRPPFINRPWVASLRGRQAQLGHKLNCKHCDNTSPVATELV